MQDQRDDAVIGVRSTARRFAGAPRVWLALFALVTLGFWAGAGFLAGLGIGYFALLGVIAAYFAWLVAFVKPGDPADCLMRFKSNALVGWLLLAALVIDHLR
jgi:4-hydroxybenzoate polyprenyltransferase